MQSCIYVVSFFKVTCDSPCKNKHLLDIMLVLFLQMGMYKTRHLYINMFMQVYTSP